jgi:hypothetical protein
MEAPILLHPHLLLSKPTLLHRPLSRLPLALALLAVLLENVSPNGDTVEPLLIIVVLVAKPVLAGEATLHPKAPLLLPPRAPLLLLLLLQSRAHLPLFKPILLLPTLLLALDLAETGRQEPCLAMTILTVVMTCTLVVSLNTAEQLMPS